MTQFTRTKEEVRALFDRWIEDNKRCEEERDWSRLADYYADDAVYQYTMGAAGLRVARGKEEVRRLVMQRDMEGFDGWTFPYEWVVIDGNKVMTRWWNQLPYAGEDGSPLRVMGVSCIELDDDLKIKSMYDCFDLAALLEVVREGNRRKGAEGHISIPDAAEAEGI